MDTRSPLTPLAFWTDFIVARLRSLSKASSNCPMPTRGLLSRRISDHSSFHAFDLRSKTTYPEHPNAVPVHVYLVPL